MNDPNPNEYNAGPSSLPHDIQRHSTCSRASMNATWRYGYHTASSYKSSEHDDDSVSDETFLPEYSHKRQKSWDNSQVYPNMSSYEPGMYESGSSSFASLYKDRPLPPLPPYASQILNDASARPQSDGRLRLAFNQRFTKTLPQSYCEPVQEFAIDPASFRDAPSMNVNIMIVGSRGDVQPYLALGQKLRDYGHTVRISTHQTFRQLVKGAGLHFFNIGGDPHELMSYMVRNPGLIPGFESLRNGDIRKKQKMIAEILEGCFQSCYEPDDIQDGGALFAADAIISNPATFAHIHCAEVLGIPLLLSFTMPWCATTAFPHPLVNIKQSTEGQRDLINYYSYWFVDVVTWQGLGHTINKFRMKRLGLPYLNTQSAVSMIERCGIPWTYCMSSALTPKPADWMTHIDIAGFYFLDLAQDYKPPPELVDFISAGEIPIYIGFGSIVLDNPREITQAVLTAVAISGVRAIISPGWGGLDKTMIESAGSNVLAVENVPHDWLFQWVSAVCHHGGAGTTAIGLKCGKPTIIVPFFGDQPWWASQIAACGAGPPPVFPKHLTGNSLAVAIRIALSPNTRLAAVAMGDMINRENGVANGAESFHRHMPLLNMRCELDPTRVAVWYSRKHNIRLSAFAAQVLVDHGSFKLKRLELHRPREYQTYEPATDPVTGVLSPSFKFIGDVGRGVAKLPTTRPDKGVKKLLEASTFGTQAMIQGATEGLHNSPKLYGSQVRTMGQVNGIGSGIAQGSKALVCGVYDGITDLVREPVKGVKNAGLIGGVVGLAVGASNCVVKPFAGAMAAVSLPLQGTAKSLRAMGHKNVDILRRATKSREGLVTFRNSSYEERAVVVQRFENWKAEKMKDKGKGRAI